jgi:gliding motility-associated-like protein
MKKIHILLLAVVFGLSFSLDAQTSRNKKAQVLSGQTADIPAADVKSRFIANQDYLLSPANVKGNKFYGDSLNGFDEAAARAELLGRNFAGSEYFTLMNTMKREFIWNKYQIGPRFAPAPPPQINQRPGGGGGGNVINVAPCVNEDFELTPPGTYNTGNAVTGWSVTSGINGNPGVACNGQPAWTSGSPEFSIVATPILGTPWNGVAGSFNINNVSIGASPLGGNNVARLQNSVMGNMATRLVSTFPVAAANTLFQFAYAGSWDGSGHGCCDQPSFTIRMYNCPGALLNCSSVSLTPSGPNCQNGNNGYQQTGGIAWTNWVVNYIDLTPFIGTCVTIEVTNSDCNGGAHHGSAYFDARCGGALVGQGLGGNGGNIGGPVSFCAGSNQAQISAPLGYSQYQWYAPNGGNPAIPVGAGFGGNTPNMTVVNPVPGTVYTVQLVTASGCTFTAIDTLKFSTVSIIGLGTTSTCPGGASGSATVQGNGSGTGYNYAWYSTQSPNTSIGSASVITNLGPGVYTVGISGFGAAGCGSAAATVTVGTSPPNVYSIIKPFCGNEAYLQAFGTNFQWYNNTTPIPANQGGTAASYTATSPTNGQIYWLTYTSNQNCRDSVQYLLAQTPPGNMYVSGVSYACPGVGNATANITMNPAANAPPGLNSYSVYSIAGPNPVYTSSLFPTASNNYVPTGMPAGTYSVISFDGSCKYSTSFTVQDYVYNYLVGPPSSTLCPNNTVLADVSFTTAITAAQYNYQWSPATWIQGGAANTTNNSIIIAPNIAPGNVITTVYTVVVTPTVVNCPITKTISVTAVNLATPSFSPILPFCTNAAPKTISVTPPGGTFSTGMGNWLGTFNGVISPNLIQTVGTNTFVYSVSISTCNVSSVGSFNVGQFNSAAIISTIQPQCTTNPCINLMGIVASQVNGVWSGAGVNPVNSNFCPGSVNAGLHTLNYNTSSTPYPNLCPDASTIQVSVSAPVTPTITTKPPFCTNIPAFTMTVTPPGGNWSSGVPLLINPAGIVNPAAAPLGATVLNYAVFTGACLNTATTVIDATLFRTAALTGSVPNLCTNSGNVNLMNIVQNQINGSWSAVSTASNSANGAYPNLNISNNVFNPSVTTSTLPTGYYILKYNTFSSPNPTVCPDSRTLMVHVLNPPTPTVLAVPAHCNVDAQFQVLVNVPATGGGSFVPTAYLSAAGVFTPANAPVGNNPVQYVVGTSTCNVSHTQMVSIEGFVDPKITGSVPDLCSTNSPVNLSGLSLNSTGSWSGPGVLGSMFDPGQSPVGNLTLIYSTSSLPSGLCPASATLAVNVFSLASPAITQAGPLCNSHAGVKLKVVPLGGLFGGENNNAVTVDGWLDPANAIIGNNIVTYTVTSGPCIAYTKSTIKIEKFISADFSKYAGPFCRNDAPLDLNSIVQNPGGTFAGPNLEGSMFNPAKANIGNGNIIIHRTHSETEDLCPDTAAMRIQVNNIPDVSVSSNTNTGCAPLDVVFNTPSTGLGRGEWTLGDGSEPVGKLGAIHTYTAPGTYTVVFNYWDELGCSTQTVLSTPIKVHGPPTAAFTYGPYQEITISDPEVQFTNQSTELGKNTYDWQIADMYRLSDVNPVVKFPKIGKYEITLTATTIYGCKDKVSQTIEVINDFGVYIPNTFTPNEDGLNDTFGPIFTPYGLDEKTFDMEIFDRWGHSLYHTKDVHKGWDGTINNKGGDRMKEEVYVYKIKYKDLDGNIYNKLGHVTLIK